MKKVLQSLLLLAMIFPAVALIAQPANDYCTNATSLGTLGAPGPCGSGIINGATTTLTGQTTVGATSLITAGGNTYYQGCGTTNPVLDVWYTFVAPANGFGANITVSGGTLANPTITLYVGTNCNALASLGCVVGAAGSATLTVGSGLQPGQTYYVQVSGDNSTQTGTFKIAANVFQNCSDCDNAASLTASPLPVNGTYQPGQTVNFCFHIDQWTQVANNWLHGVQMAFGAGWNIATLTTTAPPTYLSTAADYALAGYGQTGGAPNSCGSWIYYPNGEVSAATGTTFPAGFYFDGVYTENTAGTKVNGCQLDPTAPGNNFGDGYPNDGLVVNPPANQWDFCWSIQVQNDCTPGENLDVTVTTTGDGQSGAWTSLGCTQDPATVFSAVITCCPPTMSSTPATCANPTAGTATATPTGTNSPWTFAWSNNVTQTLTTASTITGLAAGTYTVTVTDKSGCSSTATVTVTGPTGANAGPDQSVSCVTLPGGSVTMAATGTGTWTALAGNPGTSTITTPGSATTTITTFSAPGTYTYIWTVGSCTATTTVVVTAKPNAGPDQTVTCATLPGGSATMAGTGTGTWTAQAGNPGTSTITTPGSPTTTITTFSAPGTYKYIWTSGTCTDTANVTVTAAANAGPAQTVNCVTLPGGSATMAATGTGTWTAQAGNPGTSTITTPGSPTTTITTFSAPGTYTYIWTVGTCTATTTVTVTAAANAGPAQTVNCATLPGGSATMAATGAGTWTAQAGNPGTSTITTPGSATTTITNFSVPGTYTYIWTVGTCTATTTVTVTAAANAGPSQSVSCVTLPGGSVTMAATGTGTWTAQAGNPGTSTITTPGSATTTITNFSAIGTYTYIWTVGSCTATTTVVVSALPNAGANQTVNCVTLPGGSATMAATGAGTWTAQAGNPGTSTITTPGSGTTTITNFSAPGTYTYIWTVGSCTATATVIVTGLPNAGPSQTVSCATLPGGSATMAATGAGTWTAQAGNPGTSTITTPGSPTTTITTFSAPGTYTYIWTIGSCTATTTVVVTAKPNAGPDQFVTCYPVNSSATMAATGSGTWTAQAGNPGTSTITTPGSPTTTITSFSVAGTYKYIWTNGSCTDTASVIVTTRPNAGLDQTVNCATLPGGSATMGATGNGTWTAQPGNPGTATITSSTSPTTTITTFSAPGTYNFIWTSGTCSDTAAVTVTAAPNAGPGQTVSCITLPGGSATMAATGAGTWTAQAGNPGTSTITTPGSATTTITNFSAAGTYTYIWTVGSCTATTTVTVTATPNAGPAQTVNCATLPGGSATMAATGAGTWTAQGGNPGTSTITTPGSATTTITNFNAPGTYTYIWTVGTCTATTTVTVTAAPNAGPSQTVTCITLPGGSATMAATGAGTWTAQGGNPGTSTITTPGSATTTITDFSAAGTYTYIWTVGSCTATTTVVVSTNPIAGPDQTLTCATLPGGSITMAASGTGTWTAQAGNPGTASITTPGSPTTTITTFTAEGTYNFIWGNGTCADTASVTVTAKPNAGPDQTVSCVILPGGVATMAGTGTGTWSALVTNPGTATITNASSATTTITTFSTAGTYSFVWSNTNCSDTANVIVTAKPDAGLDATICQGATASLNASGAGSWSALSNNPATTTITSVGSASTTVSGFTVAGTYGYVWTSNGCTDTADVIVNPLPTINPTVTNITCTNPVGMISANATGAPTLTYNWSNSTTASNLTSVTSGPFTVTVTDGNQCSASATATIANQIVIVTATGTSTDITCYGANDGSVTLTVTPTGQYTYSWSNGASTGSITGLGVDAYQVTVTDANGCSTTAGPFNITSPTLDSLSITPSDTSITLGDTVQLNSRLTGAYPSISYSWTGVSPATTTEFSCTNCAAPSVATGLPNDTLLNIYQLVVTYNNGCTVTAFDTIKAISNDLIGIPNAFTPNGDGKNDTFQIMATGVRSFSMNIYNRWGEQVFTTANINSGWDGTYKGKPQPEEAYTFFFTITYLDGKSESREGSLMLFR